MVNRGVGWGVQFNTMYIYMYILFTYTEQNIVDNLTVRVENKKKYLLFLLKKYSSARNINCMFDELFCIYHNLHVLLLVINLFFLIWSGGWLLKRLFLSLSLSLSQMFNLYGMVLSFYDQLI